MALKSKGLLFRPSWEFPSTSILLELFDITFDKYTHFLESTKQRKSWLPIFQTAHQRSHDGVRTRDHLTVTAMKTSPQQTYIKMTN